MNALLAFIGTHLAEYLGAPKRQGSLVATVAPGLLAAALRPGDVLLVEGNTRISVAIKYLTQSTWSHAALFVGDALPPPASGGERPTFVEADLRGGVRAVGLSVFAGLHTRICRPVGLSTQDVQKLVAHTIGRIGQQYDLRNVIDLARYLIPTPPVPARWRRRLLALGSGEPTRAICSTLIAQAFQTLRYPILPDVTRSGSADPACQHCHREILHIRHHSLYTPRDFDLSPYFDVVKPNLLADFDYRALAWADDTPAVQDAGSSRRASA
ncbi:hypothetical protein Tamer19_38140 [Cupriavidus sp. TA19]|uniref:lipo-like protein n=1 Tax=unclassified Cupriavidus TaxID=2640874 RepID=UPI000E2FBF8E|nr:MULTISPECIES: lipo-like protein [unclassified Cupriavidus]BDB29714.1 lipo-like protein [Cupriavidus sp. P-10]GLC94406.1 hypothetical protein Tamer19_38140 [Cupriavidus sp. TA19]